MYFKTEKGPVRVSSMAMQSNMLAKAENYMGDESWFSNYYYWIIGIAAIVIIIAIVMYNKNKK